jgi:Zn-dependent peptidase ImmA (M78 family)
MTKAEIQRQARETLQRHGLYSIPVNPVVVAGKLGVRPLHAVFSEAKYSGLTAKRGDDVQVLIRQGDSLVRKRFTIAHELAHVVLHLRAADQEFIDTDEDLFRTSDEASEDWSPERRREWEANVFAAELLMPSELVTRTWQSLPPDSRTVDAMARFFQVSEIAMSIRLSELGLLAR